ncbi:protein TIC 22-like, chloroplastic isoform X2 [Apium graveolens]|uniref:protein TIC 22-like, chloroplastic isoform X2 n=1 Tax=Apium graveolens TaxID=4045 RepID=UPI003D7B429C
MNFLNPKNQKPEVQLKLEQALTHLQTHFTNLQNQAKQLASNIKPPFFAINNHPNPNPNPNPNWARISTNLPPPPSSSLSIREIEERLAGVPVYALSNPADEFVLVSSGSSGKSLGLFCFKEEDVNTLLDQMKLMDPAMRDGSKVVAVALNKLKVDGVGFRLIPDSSQINYAIAERKKAGSSDGSFSGVPVFQSRSLLLKSQKTRYRPVFFRKEDLENSLRKASSDQRKMNPALREGDIQVAVFEDIILGMKDSSRSEWDDVVFIPPGFDVTSDSSQRKVSQ